MKEIKPSEIIVNGDTGMMCFMGGVNTNAKIMYFLVNGRVYEMSQEEFRQLGKTNPELIEEQNQEYEDYIKNVIR